MGVLNSCFPGLGNSGPSKQLPEGFARGGWSGLELTDTLWLKPRGRGKQKDVRIPGGFPGVLTAGRTITLI